jgi:hypothetical protein
MNTPTEDRRWAEEYLARRLLDDLQKAILKGALAALPAGGAIERVTRRDVVHDWLRVNGEDIGGVYHADQADTGLRAVAALMIDGLVERVHNRLYRLTERGRAVAGRLRDAGQRKP